MGRGMTGTEFAMALSNIPISKNTPRGRRYCACSAPDSTSRSAPELWCRIVASKGSERLEVEDAYHRHRRRNGFKDTYRDLPDRWKLARRRPRRAHDLDEPGAHVRDGGRGAPGRRGDVRGGVQGRTRGAERLGRGPGPHPLAGDKEDRAHRREQQGGARTPGDP